MKMFVASILILSSLNSMAITNNELANVSAVFDKEAVAIKFAELNRCDQNFKLSVLGTLIHDNGSVLIILAESSDASIGDTYGVKYLRIVRFAKDDVENTYVPLFGDCVEKIKPIF